MENKESNGGLLTRKRHRRASFAHQVGERTYLYLERGTEGGESFDLWTGFAGISIWGEEKPLFGEGRGTW